MAPSQFANVDINAFTSGATIMYGDENVTRSGVVVNLIDGETFDASKLSVRYGGKTYSGDDIEIINCDGADTSEEGGYNFIVRLRAFEAADGTWVGGTSSLRVFVNGADSMRTSACTSTSTESSPATAPPSPTTAGTGSRSSRSS